MAGHSTIGKGLLGLAIEKSGEANVLSERSESKGNDLRVEMSAAPIWWTYILGCCDGSFYVGSTGNLEARVQVHQSGNGPTYTATRLPIRLVYSETHSTQQAAVAREKQLKGWSRAKKTALIAGNAKHLNALSRCRQLLVRHDQSMDSF